MTKRTPEQFMERLRGIPAHHVVAVMNKHVRGVHYGGCSKRMIAECWAACSAFGEVPMRDLKKLTLDTLYAEAKALQDRAAAQKRGA